MSSGGHDHGVALRRRDRKSAVRTTHPLERHSNEPIFRSSTFHQERQVTSLHVRIYFGWNEQNNNGSQGSLEHPVRGAGSVFSFVKETHVQGLASSC